MGRISGDDSTFADVLSATQEVLQNPKEYLSVKAVTPEEGFELRLPPPTARPSKPFDFTIGSNLSAEQRDRALHLLNSFHSIFATDITQCVRSCIYEAHLSVKENHQVRYIPQYRLSPPELVHARNYVSELEKCGVVRRNEGAIFNSPLFVLPKKRDKPTDPLKYRVILSLKAINASCLKRTNYALPKIPDLLATLGGNTCFSSFDLTSSYHQINLDEPSQKLTNFTLEGISYNFVKLPLGINSAVSLFSSIIAQVLSGLYYTEVFGWVDDLFCSKPTFDEMYDLLLRIFQRFDHAHLYINPQKSAFFMPSPLPLGPGVCRGGTKSLGCSACEAPRGATRRPVCLAP